ncbi:MAG: hypothetical protein R3350_10640 [Saprospiraceae bacterium]|nr:hypothetical protein [Saprospiraceae bacterium]
MYSHLIDPDQYPYGGRIFHFGFKGEELAGLKAEIAQPLTDQDFSDLAA